MIIPTERYQKNKQNINYVILNIRALFTKTVNYSSRDIVYDYHPIKCQPDSLVHFSHNVIKSHEVLGYCLKKVHNSNEVMHDLM